MRERTTARTAVEHVVETDERGNQRIGAREVVDGDAPPTVDDRVSERPYAGERARVNGR